MFSPVQLIFYVFASMAVCSALAVITVRNPVNSVLALVLAFFSMAVLWMMLQAEFLALILVLVYVGAVMTLFLFVVMMLNIDVEQKRKGLVAYWPIGLLVVLFLIISLIATFWGSYFSLDVMPAAITSEKFPMALPSGVTVSDFSNTRILGALLYTDFAYPFEIAGVILLVAIIAAITLAHRAPSKRKVQNIDEQLSVKPEDRVRLIKNLGAD